MTDEIQTIMLAGGNAMQIARSRASAGVRDLRQSGAAEGQERRHQPRRNQPRHQGLSRWHVTAPHDRQPKRHRSRAADAMQIFIWEGKDKRGIKIKGEQPAKNASLVTRRPAPPGHHADRGQASRSRCSAASGKTITAEGHRGVQPPARDDDGGGRAAWCRRFEIIAGGQKNPRMPRLLIDIKRTDIEGGSSLARVARQASAAISTSCIATWSRPANRRACSRPCWTRSRPTRKTSKRSRARSRRRCSTRPRCSRWPSRQRHPADLRDAAVREVFKSFGADLPAFTQMVIDLSRFMIG